MNDDADSSPKKDGSESQVDESKGKILVNPVKSSVQEDPTDKTTRGAASQIEPDTKSVSLWQLFRCRFKLWRGKRRLAKKRREKAKWTDVGTLILTAFVASAAGISAWIFYKQLNAMQKQFEITDRPWIKGEPHVSSPIVFRDNGDLSLSIIFILNNVGHSVATDATVHAGAFIPKWGAADFFKQPLERQRELCGKVQPSPITVTLFPGDITQFNVGLAISKEEIEANIVPPPPGMTNPPRPPGKRIDPILFGCLDYRFSNLPERHQTGFIYNIVRTDPKSPNVPYLIIVGDTLPVANVGLQRWAFGGDYAN